MCTSRVSETLLEYSCLPLVRAYVVVLAAKAMFRLQDVLCPSINGQLYVLIM